MPEGFVPPRHKFSLKGPAPGVGFRRRTDYGDGAGGLQAPMRQDMGMDGRLAARELTDNDIPTDNLGVEILRGSRELTGRRLPRYLRGIRTEEDEFPYKHPMTEALARHERVVEGWRMSWYNRDDSRKHYLRKKEEYEKKKATWGQIAGIDPRVMRELDRQWEDWEQIWFNLMGWDRNYDPEVPEPFPNFRRDDDEDEGGAGHLPWSNSMALSQHEGLDGPLQAGQFVQSYGVALVGGAEKGKVPTGAASRAVSLSVGKTNKEKGEGSSRGGRAGEEESRGEVAVEKASASKGADEGYVEWKIEVLIVRGCPKAPSIKQACLVKASRELAAQEPRYKGTDDRLIRQGNGQMWVYPTALFMGHPIKSKHKKTSVLEQAGVVVTSHTNLAAGQVPAGPVKVKKILIQKENEGMQPPDRVYTVLYAYECTEEEMQDKRWKLEGEDGLAGNTA